MVKKFKKTDLNQLSKDKIALDQILDQINIISSDKKNYLDLQAPCILGNGILSLTNQKIEKFIEIYKKSKIKTAKFVPSSGAATRLLDCLIDYKDSKTNELIFFFRKIKNFAFYNNLEKKLLLNNLDIKKLIKEKKHSILIEYILEEKGLNFLSLPKALIPFHSYDRFERTPFEEHLVESNQYLKNNNKKKIIHFTITHDHKKLFKNKIKDIKNIKISKIDISFSTQKKSTNIIALTLDNKLVRDETGAIYLRPGGHGALIENLITVAKKTDIIFIKNIDNVIPETKNDLTVKYKKAFAGLLIDLQNKTFKYLKNLELKVSEKKILEIESFCSQKLNCTIDKNYYQFTKVEKIKKLKLFLDRPIRISGLVKNKGETGGLPFWVKRNDNLSVQIIEGSQIDISNPKIKKMVKQSTHFNPVFFVCGIKNYKGKTFNLKKFIEKDSIIITQKRYQGKTIKVMELPGLWNGGMYHWNTIFVELPSQTFAPVKNLNDLLKIDHIV